MEAAIPRDCDKLTHPPASCQARHQGKLHAMARTDPAFSQIVDKLAGFDVEKNRGGYTLRERRTRIAIARLRPFAGTDDFELFYWSTRRDKWHTFGPLGRMRLTLDEVHEILQNDPMFRIRRSFWQRIFG